MFVGCFEISISVIVKQVKSIGIIRAFCLPGGLVKSFSDWGGQKELLDCGLLGGISTQADTMGIYIQNYKTKVNHVFNLELLKVS